MKKEEIDFINRVFAQCDPFKETPTPKEILAMGYAHTKDLSGCEVKVESGCLYLDGELIERIQSMPPKVPFSETCEYWEGRCIRKE